MPAKSRSGREQSVLKHNIYLFGLLAFLDIADRPYLFTFASGQKNKTRLETLSNHIILLWGPFRWPNISWGFSLLWAVHLDNSNASYVPPGMASSNHYFVKKIILVDKNEDMTFFTVGERDSHSSLPIRDINSQVVEKDSPTRSTTLSPHHHDADLFDSGRSRFGWVRCGWQIRFVPDLDMRVPSASTGNSTSVTARQFSCISSPWSPVVGDYQETFWYSLWSHSLIGGCVDLKLLWHTVHLSAFKGF